ncbi:MAG: MFS transporter [Desulfobulbaceae bacterium]|nr:MFS transporter [Desulfobulbaceae bacterium]
MTAPSNDEAQPNLLGRILGPEKHEYVAVAWSFAYFSCVLSSYYILRPVREQSAVGSGPNTIPWLFFGTFITMMIATPIFGWVASRYPRRQFLPWVYLFFISNILIFWAIFSISIDNDSSHVWLGRVFFVWLSVFNLYVVSVFWSFMADIYTREQGRRLFGIITAGGSIGALIGGIATSLLVVKIGSKDLLPIAAGLLLIAVFCISRLRKWVEQSRIEDVAETAASEKPIGGNPFSGITHVFSSKYFGGIATSTIIASLLGTALYMFRAQLVADGIPDPDEQVRFFSNINIATNVLALIGQLLVVKNVVSRFGIGVSLSLLPIVSIAGFILVAAEPTLMMVAIVIVIRRGLGFGFSKPTTDMLYSVVTPEEKYKSKNFIETAVYRFGDLVGTWSVKGLIVVGLSTPAISVAMLPFAAVWGAIALWLGRDYRRQAKQLKEKGIA